MTTVSRKVSLKARLAFIFLALGVILTVFSRAQAGSVSPESQIQTSEHGCEGSSMEMSECVGIKLSISDQELEKIVRAMVRAQNSQKTVEAKEIATRLVRSQQAWLTLREADCALEGAQVLGGSSEERVIQSCRLERTVQRTEQLKLQSL